MDAEELILVRDVVVRFFDPLAKATTSPEEARRLLVQLGYDPPGQVTAFQDLSAAVSAVDALVRAIEALPEDPDEEAIAAAALQSLPAVAAIVVGLERFTTSIQDNFAGSPFLAQTDIVGQIARKLLDHLVVRALEDYYKTLGASLELVGLIEIEDVAVAASPFETAYRKRTVHWDRLPDLFSDPIGLVLDNLTSADEVYVYRILYLLGELAVSLGLPAGFRSPDEPALRLFNDGADLLARDDADQITTLHLPLIDDPLADLALQLYPVRDAGTGKYTGIAAAVSFGSTIDIPLGDRFHLLVKLSANVADGLGMKLSRAGGFTFSSSLFSGNPANLADSVQLGARVGLESVEASERKLVSLGTPGGMQFEIGSGALALGIEKLDRVRFFVETELKQGKLVLKSSDADGFLAKLLPADGITTEFNLGLGIANDAGLYFIGSSGLEIRLPLHLALGPVEIQYLTLGATFKAGEIPVTAATGISAKLGPLGAAVEDIGVKATFVVKGDRSGNLGPLDVAFGFKPPKGVGLSVNAGVVKGGGYLFLDFDRGEYAGALELTIADFLSLKAIGLITTRMPDGSQGFSLLIIITAEFSPGLQLGYGFKLIGVGGLLGLNRTVVLQALAEGVRTNAVDGILFPTDPVANAPRIISDLRTIFPPYRDRFLIGPMAKLGWGTPTLISLSLGVIIEIPGNVAILGVLKAVLPDEDAAVLKLQVNFIGAIEFDKKRGWFFAALYDSRLVFITIEGEFGVLIAVGEDANFVLSAGGFHPRFSPPPLPFPSPRRIALTIIDTSVARIRAETYFAITTNTVQAGMRAELFFGFDSVAVEGHMAFDALIRFSPFYLIVEVAAGASVKAFGLGLFSIDLAFTLEGPTPWRARGRGSVSLWFVKISADFDVTWGEAADTTLPPIAVVSLIRTELEKADNWRALPPPSTDLLVSLRKLDLPGDALVLHPVGTLEVSQNAIPLGTTLETVGAQQPSDANRFTLGVASTGLARRRDARRRFAPAQFRKLDDAQKLAAPAFQEEISGIELGVAGAELRTGRAVKRSLRYEVTTIDTAYRRFVLRFHAIGAVLFAHLVKGAAIAKHPGSKAQRDQARPFDDRIEVGAAGYAVVHKRDNRAAAPESAGFATEREAQEWLSGAAAGDPQRGGGMHVVPVFEMSAGG
jgi:uncharacterized protein DUF6603